MYGFSAAGITIMGVAAQRELTDCQSSLIPYLQDITGAHVPAPISHLAYAS